MSLSEKAGQLENLANGAKFAEVHQALSLVKEKLDYVATNAHGIIGDLPAKAQITNTIEAVKAAIDQNSQGVEQIKQTIMDTANRVRQAGASS